jgi:hypothetical protein
MDNARMNQDSRRFVLGVFSNAEQATNASSALRESNFQPEYYPILSGAPHADAISGEPPLRHRLFAFPLLGAAAGFALGFLFTMWTQLSFPSGINGESVLSLPPTAMIIYEAVLLGAIVFTVLGMIFESRQGEPCHEQYARSINDGYLGVLVSCDTQQVDMVKGLFREVGALDVKEQVTLPD